MPGSAWGATRSIELYRYKSRQGIPTWEQAIETLLDSRLEKVES